MTAQTRHRLLSPEMAEKLVGYDKVQNLFYVDEADPFKLCARDDVYLAHMNDKLPHERGFVLLNQDGEQISSSYNAIRPCQNRPCQDGILIGIQSSPSQKGKHSGKFIEADVLDTNGNVLRHYRHFLYTNNK